MPRILVLDASVAFKWFVRDEVFWEIANKLLIQFLENQIEFHAPHLLKYELANSLYKAQKASNARISPFQCQIVYKRFFQLPIKFHIFHDSEMQSILEFSVKFNRNFYDSTYVWLAGVLDCEWLTCDEKYCGQLPDGFPRERILMLQDFS